MWEQISSSTSWSFWNKLTISWEQYNRHRSLWLQSSSPFRISTCCHNLPLVLPHPLTQLTHLSQYHTPLKEAALELNMDTKSNTCHSQCIPANCLQHNPQINWQLLQLLQEEEEAEEVLFKQPEGPSVNPAKMQTKERVFSSHTIKRIQDVQYVSNSMPSLRTISLLKWEREN